MLNDNHEIETRNQREKFSPPPLESNASVLPISSFGWLGRWYPIKASFKDSCNAVVPKMYFPSKPKLLLEITLA